ncbi:DNA repair protein RecO [Bacillota bacterium]
MFTETEGIVLKQTKIAAGRRMILLFSKRYGKISAGTSISEGGKNRAALALRPFVHGKYQINKSGDSYHINGCETLSSHYSIGEDVDKYLCASYGLEFTNKVLPEEAAAPRLFLLLAEFLDQMEKRGKKYETLLVAYQMKALALLGSSPQLDSCVICGNREGLSGFCAGEGGMVCNNCIEADLNKERLIYAAEFDIVNVINFLIQSPLSSFENLALDARTLKWTKEMLKKYIDCHLGISCLKSEECMKPR